MKRHCKIVAVVVAGFAAGVMLMRDPILAQAPAPAPAGNQDAGRPRFGGFIKSTDPRVQNRTYHFADTNEDLPYCVFVSSKVSKDKQALQVRRG